MATTSNEDFLKLLKEKKHSHYLISIIDDDNNEILETDAVMVDYLDATPNFDKIIEAGYWGGQTRYNDDCEYDEDDNLIEDNSCDTICIGSYCTVDRGELLFWKVTDMPLGFYEKYRFKEFRVLYH